MTDRELLELAARAIDIELCWDAGLTPYRTDNADDWNPLEDDGDEARLEAALGMSVHWWGNCVTVRDATEFFAEHGNKQAARRRAGVRAAAALAVQPWQKET